MVGRGILVQSSLLAIQSDANERRNYVIILFVRGWPNHLHCAIVNHQKCCDRTHIIQQLNNRPVEHNTTHYCRISFAIKNCSTIFGPLSSTLSSTLPYHAPSIELHHRPIRLPSAMQNLVRVSESATNFGGPPNAPKM